jgi:hypothetical protein
VVRSTCSVAVKKMKVEALLLQKDYELTLKHGCRFRRQQTC